MDGETLEAPVEPLSPTPRTTLLATTVRSEGRLLGLLNSSFKIYVLSFPLLSWLYFLKMNVFIR